MMPAFEKEDVSGLIDYIFYVQPPPTELRAGPNPVRVGGVTLLTAGAGYHDQIAWVQLKPDSQLPRIETSPMTFGPHHLWEAPPVVAVPIKNIPLMVREAWIQECGPMGKLLRAEAVIERGITSDKAMGMYGPKYVQRLAQRIKELKLAAGLGQSDAISFRRLEEGLLPPTCSCVPHRMYSVSS